MVKKAVNICRLKLFYSGEQKKSLHFSDNSIFQTCSPSITGNLSTHELPNVSNQDPISHISCQAFKRPMRIESSIEDVGILDSACLPGSSCNESKLSIPAVGNVGFLRISGEEIAPVDTSNSHSTTVIGEDLNSVLSMFNKALQNAYDAGNWIQKCCATTHVLSHQYLDTAESIEQSCYCGSDAVQDNFDNFATSTPQKNCGLYMPFNCMSFSPICKLPSVSIESLQHRNESLTASTVQK